MFTGIVQALGQIKEKTPKQNSLQLVIQTSQAISTELKLGSSLLVNGCCLSVSRLLGENLFQFDLSAETLVRTNFGAIEKHMSVNLELALKVNDRLEGHMVSGHVDSTAQLVKWVKQGDAFELAVGIDAAFSSLVIPKGSICLDGISLTINRIDEGKSLKDHSLEIALTIIPITIQKTHLQFLPKEWAFNVEFDLVGKYIQRMNKK